MKFLLALLVLNIQGKRNIEFVVKDAFTGKRVNAAVKVYKGKRVIDSFDSKSKFVLSLSSDEEYRLYIKSKGYRPLKFKLLPSARDGLTVTIYLSPYVADSIFPKSKEKRVIKGYVSDINGTMLKNVKVILKGKGISTVTDSNGIFVFKLPRKNVKVSHENIPKDTVLLMLPGYKTLVKEILDIPENLVLKLMMKKGKGQIFQGEFKSPGSGECGEQVLFQGPGRRKEKDGSRSVILDPPAVIRVGTDCIGTDCSGISIMNLETYVSTGLDDEWIASWPVHSLRAGALAYRSYGSWYVNHPIDTNYDICSNTCCQVWDGSDVYQSAYEAAYSTAGILLERYGSYARSEYSAENNNCGCGDGYAGDGIYWPCVSDTICSGHSCYGHGRGMCQWGSSRWATLGYTWKWIIEHYYNPGDINIASPMMILSATSDNTNVNPGESFTIRYDVYSFGEVPLYNIFLGASIYNESYGFFSDPANDTGCVIQPDTTTTVYRKFTVGDSVPTGSYDLYVALWLDVDDDNKITSRDLPLHLLIMENAIEVENSSLVENPYKKGFSWLSDAVSFIRSANTQVFKFYLPENSYVEVYLYDKAGRIVQKYFSGKMKTGVNFVQVKSQNLRNGIYFLVVEINKREKLICKIIVIK